MWKFNDTQKQAEKVLNFILNTKGKIVVITGERGFIELLRVKEEDVEFNNIIFDSSLDNKAPIKSQYYIDIKVENGGYQKGLLFIDMLSKDKSRNKVFHPNGGLSSEYDYTCYSNLDILILNSTIIPPKDE